MKLTEILERLNYKQIKDIEKQLDKLFHLIDIDISFSGHFKERIIKRDLKENEIIETFQNLYSKYKTKIKKNEYKALIYNVINYLNIPIKVEYNKNKDIFVLTSKSIFKKENPESTADKNKEEILKV